MICAATLSGFLESVYLVENFGLSTGYASEMRRVVRQLNAHCGYEVTLAELSSRIVSPFLAKLLADGATPTTVNNKRRELRTLWRYAARKKLTGKPDRIKILAQADPIPTAWTTEQCGQIFAECRNLSGSIGGIARSQWWLSLWLTVYSAGERIKATRHARTLDCDLEAGTLFLRWQTVKTRKNRIVYLIPEAVEAIRSIYDPTRELIWPWPHNPRHFFRKARAIVEAAGVPAPKRDGKNLFQRMRRTSGSIVEAAGGDGARHLGHARKVFEKHYRAESWCGGSQAHLIPRPNIAK